ncbi:hypothetical protein [Clavibacter sp. Sh2088]|uniref:hypothetical protein n=1 Tax=Clavibacter sp. Sh2088 TaxID=3397676 RepID=UPI0039E0531E
MPGELEIDREGDNERRRSGRLSTDQSMTLMGVAVVVSAGVQAFSSFELLGRLGLFGLVFLLVFLVGATIIRRRNSRVERDRS